MNATVNLDNIVSISEANQNFSKVARMVDEDGIVIILKNNKPLYQVTKIVDNRAISARRELFVNSMNKIIRDNHEALTELAK